MLMKRQTLEANTLNPSLASHVNAARRFETQPDRIVHTSRIEIPLTGILSLCLKCRADCGVLAE